MFVPAGILNSADKPEITFTRCAIQDSLSFNRLVEIHERFKGDLSTQACRVQIENLKDSLLNYSSESVDVNINARLAPALRYIEQHLPEKFSNDHLAGLCNLSKYYFQTVFRKLTGLTIKAYIHQQRMAKGKELLLTGSNINVVAFETGYYDQSHFHHQFKKMWGLTPGAFIR